MMKHVNKSKRMIIAELKCATKTKKPFQYSPKGNSYSIFELKQNILLE